MCLADGPPKRASRKQRLALSLRRGRISPRRTQQEKVRLVSVHVRRMRPIRVRPGSVHMRRMGHMRVRPGSIHLKRVRHILVNNLPQRKPYKKDAFLDLNLPTTHSNVLNTKRLSAAPVVMKVSGKRTKTRSGLGMRNL